MSWISHQESLFRKEAIGTIFTKTLVSRNLPDLCATLQRLVTSAEGVGLFHNISLSVYEISYFWGCRWTKDTLKEKKYHEELQPPTSFFFASAQNTDLMVYKTLAIPVLMKSEAWTLTSKDDQDKLNVFGRKVHPL